LISSSLSPELDLISMDCCLPVPVSLAERAVVPGELALALQDVDIDRRLAVGRRREDLLLAGRDGCVAVDQLGHHAAQRLDAQRQGRHVQQQDVLDADVAHQYRTLDGGAQRDDLVGVEALVGLLAENLLGNPLDLRNPRGAADEQDLGNVLGSELGVLEGPITGRLEPLEDVVAQRLEPAAGQGDLQVLRAGGVGRDERQVHCRLQLRAELDLGFLGRLDQPLVGHRVLEQVDALFLAEFLGEVVDQHGVQVVTPKMRIAVGAEHLEDVVPDVENGDIEGAAAEIEDGHLFVSLLFQAVSQRRRCGLVDDALDLEPRDRAGVLRRLPLGVVEVRGHRDDGPLDLLAQVGFRGLLEVLENHRGNLRRRVQLAPDLDLHQLVRTADHLVRDEFLFLGHLAAAPAHKPLDGIYRVLRVGNLLMPGELADQDLALVREPDHRGGQPSAGRVDQHLRRRAFHDGYNGQRRSQVYSDNLVTGHALRPFLALAAGVLAT
jgi:hypothetical protein